MTVAPASPRAYFTQALSEFTLSSGLTAPAWLDVPTGLAAVIDRLKTLREEGMPLRPDVYFFHDDEKERLERVLGFHHFFRVGAKTEQEARELGPQLFELAVKKCAPLARGNWSIFLKWTAGEAHFGVMRRRDDLIRQPARVLLQGNADVRVVLAYQVAENVVALRAGLGLARNFDFFASSRLMPSAEEDRRFLEAMIAAQVEGEIAKAHAEAVVAAILHEAIGSGHGFLIGVKVHGDGRQNDRGEWIKAPKTHYTMADGNYFPKWPIPLHAKLAAYASARGCEASEPRGTGDLIESALRLSEELQAWRGLVPTMLSSDGMTLFDTRAQVLGFNIFVGKLKKDDVAPSARFPPPIGRHGGARWRAFANMRQLVDANVLAGAYYQSQDGAGAWYGPRLESAETNRESL